jgi:hypothetical protein
LGHVVKELRRVSPAIISTEKPICLDSVPSMLRTRAWRLNGDSYVLVVNPEATPVKARLKLPERFLRASIEAGAGLKLVGGNAINVDFAPLGYGVIRLSPVSR